MLGITKYSTIEETYLDHENLKVTLDLSTTLMLAISKINKMGQCTSSNEIFNQSKKSDRQLRTGLKFKDIEFGGFIGYSVTINNVYTPSGIDQPQSRGDSERSRPSAAEGGVSERVEPQTEITS